MGDWVQTALKSLRSRQIARQAHKNSWLDELDRLETDKEIQTKLLKQYPILQTYLNLGYVFESYDPLVMRHPDHGAE